MVGAKYKHSLYIVKKNEENPPCQGLKTAAIALSIARLRKKKDYKYNIYTKNI